MVERKHEKAVRLRVCYDYCVSIGLFEKGKGTICIKNADGTWDETKWFERADFQERLDSTEVNALVDAYYQRLEKANDK